MILLSLGTHQQPFPRAVYLVQGLADPETDLIIQHGSTPARADVPNSTWVDFMPYQEMIDTMAKADSVVCHAGVGTIMTALKVGHTPIVIPRQAQHGEHVDDHQLDIATNFAQRGLIHCVLSESDLTPSLVLRTDKQSHQLGRGCNTLRAAVADAVAAEPVRGRLGQRWKSRAET